MTATDTPVIHLFRYYTSFALCGERRPQVDAVRDRVDRVPTTLPTCMSCIAVRQDDGDVYYGYPAISNLWSLCYVTKDGLTHAVTPAPQGYLFFRLCDKQGGGEIIYAIDAKHLRDAHVTCFMCIDAMSQPVA